MTTNHTPTPWEARTGKAAHACIYVQGTDHDVAIGMRPDDAAHIVRCVNAHDALVAALNTLVEEVRAEAIDGDPRVRAAIKAARTVLAQLKEIA